MRKVLSAEGHEVPREGISIDADRETREWMDRAVILFTPITAEAIVCEHRSEFDLNLVRMYLPKFTAKQLEIDLKHGVLSKT